MVNVVSDLASFEVPNTFALLQLHNDESIADVESPEEILQRIWQRASDLAAKDLTKPRDFSFSAKANCFQEGELDDGWTIVASRKTKRSNKTEDEEQSIEEPESKPAMKSKKWSRSLVALGTAAAVGLASFLFSRRLRRNEAA